MGCFAFLSAAIKPIRPMTAAIITPRNAFEVHPKFWPKDGMHSTKLKKISTSTAPILSKFCNGRLWEACFPIVNTQAIKVMAQMATQPHSIARQSKAEMINPPSVGPRITDALEISIYKENPFAA